MPYSSVESLPKNLKNYSSKIQRQWMYVFNSTYKKTNGDEGRSFKAANSVLKKRFKSSKSMEKNTRVDYINHLVDTFLGNLEG